MALELLLILLSMVGVLFAVMSVASDWRWVVLAFTVCVFFFTLERL
jgi:bacteriorhodopsin